MSINRWQLILNKLLLETDLSIKDLCIKTGLSKHIIKSSIEMINDNLKSILKIETNLKGNYYLTIVDSSTFSEIIGIKLKSNVDFTSSSKRKAYIILKLTNNTYVTIENLAQDTKVSIGTLKSDLKSMRSLLEKYDLKIRGIPNKGFMIIGNEINIRALLTNYVYDFFPNEFIPPKNIDKYLNDYIDGIDKLEVDNTLLKKNLYISYIRFKKSFFIMESPKYFENTQKNTHSITELVKFIEQNLEISLNEAEKQFLKYPLHLTNQTGFELTQSNEVLLKKIYNRVMDAIHSEYIIEIEKEEFFLNIRNHLITLINRLIFYTKPFDIFSKNLSHTYPLPYQMSTEAIRELGKILNRPINEVEINFFTIYFELFLQKKFQNYKRRIAIVSDSGLSVNKLIEQQLTQVLGKDIEITYFSESLTHIEELNDFSLIFSNIPIKNNLNQFKIIRISNIFDRNWFPLDSFNDLYLTRIVEKNIFFKKNSFSEGYLSDLGMMVEELINAEAVDRKFGERICKSINRSSFYKDDVAFPHVVNKKSEEIIIYFFTNDNNQVSDNQSINTIILLAIPENLDTETESELVRIYDFIFKLIGNVERMNLIKQIETKEELLFLLNKWGDFL